MPIYVLCPDNSVKEKKKTSVLAPVRALVGTGNLAHTRFGTAAKGGLMSDVMINDRSRGFLLVKNNQQSDDMHARHAGPPILYVAVGGLYVACSKVNSGSCGPSVLLYKRRL